MLSIEIARQFLAYRELDDGRLLALVPLIFGRASLTLGPGGDDYDGSFNEAWDYDDATAALYQLITWDPATSAEPVGWTRHAPSMRRRGESLAELEERRRHEDTDH